MDAQLIEYPRDQADDFLTSARGRMALGHIVDFEGDLYGKPIVVEFMHWLRPMRKFDDVDELIATVQGNIAWVRENL